jgi:hypothetical protein
MGDKAELVRRIVATEFLIEENLLLAFAVQHAVNSTNVTILRCNELTDKLCADIVRDPHNAQRKKTQSTLKRVLRNHQEAIRARAQLQQRLLLNKVQRNRLKTAQNSLLEEYSS